MTITTAGNRASYSGDGVTTAFSFPYKFLADADLVVLLVLDSDGASTTQVLTTNYTVSGAGDAGGGTVTMLVAPPSGYTLIIYGDPALTQSTDLVENDDFPSQSVEDALDRNVLLVQRLKDLIERSFRLADSDISGASLEIPTPEASKLLGFNAAADALVLYAGETISDTIVPTSFMETLLDDSTAAEARSTLGAFASADLLDEDDMASNSATKAASQQSAKAYVDAQITAQIAADKKTTAKVKTADESLASTTTFQNDDHLSVTLAANTAYHITIRLHFYNSAQLNNGGYKITLTGLTGSPVAYSTSNEFRNGTDISVKSFTAWNSSVTGIPAGGFDAGVNWDIVMTDSGDGGALTLQWAQAASNGNTLTLKNGSSMVVTEVDT